MFKIVKPLRVAPAIKATRWVLLICGIFHGSWKLQRLRAFEATEHIIREKKIKEKHEAEKREMKLKTIDEVISVAREFDITEMPPNWQEEL